MLAGTSWKLIQLVNRPEELKAKEEALEARRGVFFRDEEEKPFVPGVSE